jgi:hypothetical protein
MTEFTVRNYQPADREAVFHIAADTAFFGEPVEAFLDDRRLFCDVFYSYYTDREPEHAWVACADGDVVGFLTGCTDNSLQRKHQPEEFFRPAWNLLRGKYRLGRKTFRYVMRLALAGLSSRRAVLDLIAFPAHLHINVSAAWRGHGPTVD